MKPLLLLLTLLVGEEQILTIPSYGLAGYNVGPSVAASSTNYVAAWFTRPPQSAGLPGRIVVMPFDENGAAAKSALFLDDAFGVPGVGSNGDDYLLAWCVDGAITVRRLAKNGTPLGSARTLTPSQRGGQFGGRTRVLWNGAHYVVVAAAHAYFENVIRNWVEVAIVDTDRRVTIPAWELFNDAATIPGLTLYLSTALRALKGRFLDDAGNVSAPFPITTDAVGWAAIASDGGSFLAAWITDKFELRVARIGLDGTISPPVTVAASGVAYIPPALAWNGREFVLAWSTETSTQYAVVTETSAGPPLTVPPAASGLALRGRDGVSALAIGHGVIVGRLIRGSEITAVDLSTVMLDQYAPRLAGDALYFLEGAGGTTPSVIRQTSAGREFVITAVAYDADENAVAWIDGEGRAGIVLRVPNATVVRALPAEGNALAFASNGGTRLLVFRRGSAVWAARVDAAGTLLDPDGVQLSNGSAFPTNLHAVWRGDDFLVQWQEDLVVKSALVAQKREIIDFTLPPGGVVHNLAASGGKTAIAWSVVSELHLGLVDPEAPSAGPIVARDTIRSAAVFAVPSGFDVEWLTPNDLVPGGEITWASPRLILYSKGSVIARRAIAKARRRAAAAP